MSIIERTKNSVKSLVKSGLLHIISSSVVNKIITFACGIILVRIISKEAYGVYSYANNIFGFFMLASGLGAPAAVLQLCSESKTVAEREKFYKFGCFFGLGFNIILAFIILGTALFIKLPIDGSNYCLALMSFLPLAYILS